VNPRASRRGRHPRFLPLWYGCADRVGRFCRRQKRSIGDSVDRERGEDRSWRSCSSKASGSPVYGRQRREHAATLSSGQRDARTPAGIFSVSKRKRAHSNLYDDAYTPTLQSITWSGFALHADPYRISGVSWLRPNAHFDFAAAVRATQMGMRVTVAPNDVEPVEIAINLFLSKQARPPWPADRTAERRGAMEGRSGETRRGTDFRGPSGPGFRCARRKI